MSNTIIKVDYLGLNCLECKKSVLCFNFQLVIAGIVDEDDHNDSVDEKKNDDEITKNPYYGVEAENSFNSENVRQSDFDNAENIKISENPYYG